MATVAAENVRYPAEKPFDARRWIEVERLRLVSNLLSTLLAGLASAALVAFLLREVAPVPLLIGWLVAGTLISWNRYRNLRRFRTLPDEEIDTSTWSVRLKVGTALSGVFWGSAGVLFFPSDDLAHQMIILFALAGVSAGAVTSYAPVRGLYFLFVPPTVLPVVVRLALEGDEIHLVMCVLTLLFLAVVVRSAIEMDRTITNVLKVRAENTLLTQALRHQATHDALVDLDLFKQVNDNAGHAAGDETLRRVGRILKGSIRSDDTAARLGGDEFSVLLPRCPRERAEQIAGRVLSAIVNLPLEFEGKRFRVSASIGVAYTDAGEHDPTAMLRAADAACYSAKNGGRGRVEVHHADPAAAESGRFELSKLKQYFPGG